MLPRACADVLEKERLDTHVDDAAGLLPAAVAGSLPQDRWASSSAAVSKRGYDIWSQFVVERGSEQLAVALRALKASASNLKRAWDEVAVEVETETGETKEEKMQVPSAVLPHTLCLLLETASAVHDVRSPPLALHGATVQGLVERLGEAVVAVHEQLSDDALGESSAVAGNLS